MLISLESLRTVFIKLSGFSGILAVLYCQYYTVTTSIIKKLFTWFANKQM